MERIDKLRALMAQHGVDACLLAKPQNVSYISGFNNTDAYVLLTEKQQFLFTDFRYIEQAVAEAPDFEIEKIGGGKLLNALASAVSDKLVQAGARALWFEGSYVSYAFYSSLSGELDDVQLVDMGDALERMRAVKDEDEIALIAHAAAVADKVFEDVLEYIKPGVTERQLAARIEFIFKEQGCDGVSFPTIVASGKHSSMPHAQPSDKALEPGDFVTMDFGGLYKGYCSDMTRTVVLGRASPVQRRIYDTVLEAQLAALNNIKAGMDCKAADALARDVISSAGYGEYFGHSLGHGVGREIHELPTLSPNADGVLPVNAVVTVEPGIYIPGVGGVRIEDLIIVRDGYIQNLTSSIKELIEL